MRATRPRRASSALGIPVNRLKLGQLLTLLLLLALFGPAVSELAYGYGIVLALAIGVLAAGVHALGSDARHHRVAIALAAPLTHHHARVYSTRFVYYSLVTLTTLGFCDITPVSTLARSFSAVEAVIGPVFLARTIHGRSSRDAQTPAQALTGYDGSSPSMKICTSRRLAMRQPSSVRASSSW